MDASRSSRSAGGTSNGTCCRARTVVLDGEIVALSGPRPDFTALQRRMTAGRPGAGLLAAVPVMLIVFDVLRSGRDQLVRSPYVPRRPAGRSRPAFPWHCAGTARVPWRRRGVARRHPGSGQGIRTTRLVMASFVHGFRRRRCEGQA